MVGYDDDERIERVRLIALEATDLVAKIALLERRQADREAWLAANKRDEQYTYKLAIYTRDRTRLVNASADWRRLARQARVQAVRMSGEARRQLVAFGLDYTHTVGDSDNDLREQWRPLFESVNLQPCPF